MIKLIDACELAKIPVVFTVFRNLPNSPFERLLGWRNVRQTPETDLYEAIIERAAVVVEKNYYTALTDEFDRLAKMGNWETILVCGISTESCVLKTAVDAFEKGFRPVVISNACVSDLGHEMHAKGLDILEVLIGKNQIMTMEQILAWIDLNIDN